MKKHFIITLIVLFSINSWAQQNKKPLTFDDILKWNRITEKVISNDGATIVYKVEPWKGDPVLKIADKTGKELSSIIGGTDAFITNDSKYVVFTIKPKEETVRQLKLKETKKEDIPLNQLGIYSIENMQLKTVDNLISVEVPKKWNGWIAYQTKTEIVKDTTIEENDQKSKVQSKTNGYALNVYNLNNESVQTFPFVTDFLIAKEKEVLSLVFIFWI